jgi:hypothetical protein
MSFMNFVFPEYDRYLSSIIINCPFSKNSKFFLTFEERPRQNRLIFDHVMKFLELDILWKKISQFWQQQQHFLVKHKVLKNSLLGQIWSNFDNFSLKMSGKAWIFFKMGDKKILLGIHPSYSGKTKITKVNFLMNFVRAPHQRARTNNVCLKLAF